MIPLARRTIPMSLLTMHLDPVQIRTLGALIEKEITTPENYPLSLNALVNACNQKSSRDPVMELTDADVRTALFDLEALNLARTLADSRVSKYEHRVRDALQLRRDETAVLCLLLLRGPQTPGELRTRSERMYAFDDLAAVTGTLNRVAARTEGTGPLVAILPHQPGSREARYTHLLGGPPDLTETAAPTPTNATQTQLTDLQSQIEALTARVEALENKASN